MSQAGKRAWTWMVYLAGDNNLENYGTKDLFEMKQVGSTPQVAVVAQFDSMSDNITRRYYLKTGNDLKRDVVAELPEVNTGDPSSLLNFIIWAVQNYPADHYALVLWNHGTGWKEDDIYNVAAKDKEFDPLPRNVVRGLTNGHTGRALFRSTVAQIVDQDNPRGILYDDSSADFLDNAEMKNVFQQAVQMIGKPIDLLGMDACLMNMVEVNYQLLGLCRIVVASQEIEPGDGWPYDAILGKVVHTPDMAIENIAKLIVEEYTAFYSSRFPSTTVTQSAISMDRIQTLTSAIDELAKGLNSSMNKRTVRGLISDALRYAQTFKDRDYIDLTHFCQLLAKGNRGDVGTAARKVVQTMLEPGSPVIACSSSGYGVENVHGLSIYMPGRFLSPAYDRLDFAQQNAWSGFLKEWSGPPG